MGGNIQGKFYARDEDEFKHGRDLGYDFDKVLTINDMVSSEDVFFAATGITRGDLLDGVSYFADSVRTDSLVMRGLTGTVRQIISTHQLEKFSRISQITY